MLKNMEYRHQYDEIIKHFEESQPKIESSDRHNIGTQDSPVLRKLKACNFGNIYRTSLKVR